MALFRLFFKKRIFLNVAFVLLLMASFVAAPAAAEPIKIGNANQFEAFKTQIESYGVGSVTRVDAELTDNITLEGWTDGIGKGNFNTPYNGTFDGKGYKITIINESLTHNQSLSLFQFVSADSVIQNLVMDVRARAATTSVNVNSISPIAAINHGTIRNVRVNCALRGTSSVSGAVGLNFGRIEYVTVTGWIENCGLGGAAGIAAQNYPDAVISHCVNNAAIKATGASGSCVAGLVGVLNGRLEYSANHGDVINLNGYCTGGLVGFLNDYNMVVDGVFSADIYNCYNAGSVSGPGADNYVGGLSGGYEEDGTQFKEDCGIVNSFNYGQVTVGSGSSAAILGTVNVGGYGNLGLISGVTVAGLGVSQNVYYLDTSASKLFGPGAPAENAVSDKFISMTADDFKTSSKALYNPKLPGKYLPY
jgi:hypothetical protein